MANPDGELTVAERLGRALDRGLLPAGGPAEAAERLIERLERPARVGMLGLPGSGKSSILNLLVGSAVIPETLRLPTIIVQHGDVARMICTLTDGTTKILPGSDLAQVLPLAPALVTLEMDLPALKVISLLEVSAGPMEAEQKRAATWASKRSDLVIWCTTSYLPKEQAVWESLPDGVKDNSFMFLTKVDLLGGRESAQAMHQRVELRAGEEFRQILSISAKQARAAMPVGGPVNRDLFRDSGASAVITAIKTSVQSGRRADTDTGELLLARHVEASELVARRFAEPGEVAETPTPWTPPPEQEDVATATPDVEHEVEVEPEIAPEIAEVVDVDGLADEIEETAEAEGIEPDDYEVEPDLIAEVEDEPELPEPEVEDLGIVLPEAAAAVSDPDPVAEGEPTSRKRFADRIKRVATDGDAAPAPMVPLRSTWKSKAETEASVAPEPEPVVRPPEPTRRPRPVAPPAPAREEDSVAKLLASVVAKPEEPAPTPRERTPRAVTPRPAPAVEPARPARPQLFGGRRAVDETEPALQDLSGLRATAEEMAESAEATDEVDEVSQATPQVSVPLEILPDDDWEQAEPEAEAVSEPEPEPPAPVVQPTRTVDRQSLFNREPRPRPPEPTAPAEPAAPTPRTAPISRSPAPQRMPAPAASADVSRSAADEEQFSPRAIMMRERRAEPDVPAPRRERTRIAARAVPVVAPSASATVSGTDQSLVDEAIRVIVSRSAELAQDIDPEGKVPVDLILDHARETGEHVMALVSRGQSDALRRINDDLGGVLDTITLMQLEKGHAPADDALTLLLQLKRELETLSAV